MNDFPSKEQQAVLEEAIVIVQSAGRFFPEGSVKRRDADANAEALLAMISKPRYYVDEAAIRDRTAQSVPVAIVYDNCPISADRFAAMLNEEVEG